MRANAVISLAVLLALVMIPLTALAQDEIKYETYTSEDGLLSVAYPEGWASGFDTEMPFPNAYFANSEEALAKLMSAEDTTPDSGEVGILVAVLPTAFLALTGTELPADASPTDLAQAVVTSFFVPEDPDAEEQPEIGEAEEVMLSEEEAWAGGLVPVTQPDLEGAFVVAKLQEDLLLVTYLATVPGEYSDELGELLLAVAGSVSYEGTADDVLAGMMGLGAETAPGDAAALDGAALVAERCSVCHTTDRIDAASKDEAGWTTTVDRMIAKGAQLDSAEREAVIAYLSSR